MRSILGGDRPQHVESLAAFGATFLLSRKEKSMEIP